MVGRRFKTSKGFPKGEVTNEVESKELRTKIISLVSGISLLLLFGSTYVIPADHVDWLLTTVALVMDSF
jgi:hypothetical protein